MSNELMIPAGLGQLPAAFQGQALTDELAGGIGQSFGIITYKGKVWHTKFQGVEKTLMRDDGDGPRNSIEVVIIKAAPVISKIWYETGYVEGSSAPPDCWSVNGMTPDPASPKKQSTTCAGCPKNVFGSRVSEAGKPTKECMDSKRLAVVPLEDIDNEIYNGPMMLRVPAASLKELVAYSNQLRGVNFDYYMVGTRISFDVNEAYPKFQLRAIRALTDAEAAKVIKLREDSRVKRIIEGQVEAAMHEPAKAEPAKPNLTTIFEQPPQQAAPTTVSNPAPAPTPPVVIKPKVEPQVRSGIGELPDGTEVEYNLDTGEVIRVIKEAPKVEAPKPVIKPKATTAPATDETAGVAPEQFTQLLDGLLKTETAE